MSPMSPILPIPPIDPIPISAQLGKGTSSLPSQPKIPYIKPTVSNTSKRVPYVPTHKDLFRVEFGAIPLRNGQTDTNGDNRPDPDNGRGEETFSSRLVAVRVSPSFFYHT